MESDVHFVQDTVSHFKAFSLRQPADCPSLAQPEDLGEGPPPDSAALGNHGVLVCSRQHFKQPCLLQRSLKGRGRLRPEAETSGQATEMTLPEHGTGETLAASLAATPECG